MNNNSYSYIVSSYIECNSATRAHDDATYNETLTQPPNLLSLATKVIERNKRNYARNQSATSSLREDAINATEKIGIINSDVELHRKIIDISLAAIEENQQSCSVAFPIEQNHATHFTCGQCGYRQPFCVCKLIVGQGLAICNDCQHFTVDNIGDGTGIGNCELGIKWTQEFTGRMPLFRYSERHCKQFSG